MLTLAGIFNFNSNMQICEMKRKSKRKKNISYFCCTPRDKQTLNVSSE